MATSTLDTLSAYTTAYNIVAYQLELELERARRAEGNNGITRLPGENNMNELDRQLQEAERLLTNIRPIIPDTAQEIADMLMYGQTMQHIGQNPEGEVILERIDPRTTITNGGSPNLLMMDEAGNGPDFTNQMSIQRNTTRVTGGPSYQDIVIGRGWEDQINSNTYAVGTTITEQDFREAMEMLSRNSNRDQTYTMLTGTAGMDEVRRRMVEEINSTTITDAYGMYVDNGITFSEELKSYKNNKILVFGDKNSKDLKVEVLGDFNRKHRISFNDSNPAVYEEVLRLAKMERFNINVNGNSWLGLGQ